ncbi:MAG: selenocysteine-specific translation elongation factor, partial [Pyrinomonadaceae bacterium]|nr:selenocysteine-specific translation elongation factor [Pyrinomonadaceae bacterium]
MDIIVGTAGHIDHGKTALVKALTGVDADRLPEEKKRGITIDLGFAELDLGDVRIGFVDVPGHEKFVKNMLAGASGIDVVVLVVAADEGVMPQTREHFEICRLLKTKRGIIVLTKKDLADRELIELVELDVKELVKNSFLENSQIISVSSKTGEGIEELRSALRETARKIPKRRDDFVPRLPIDRTFSIKGFGAVVTGTLASGEIATGSEKQLLPIGKKVRVRGLQTHGKDVGKVRAGQRTAVNLGGIDNDEIDRGMVLTEPETLRATQIIDSEIEVLDTAKRPLRSRQRVRVHLGTVEALARIDVLDDSREIAPGESGFVQIRLERPIAAVPGEHFILRQYSPQITIAGGGILDALARKHQRKDLPGVIEYLSALIKNEDETDSAARLRIFLETEKDAGSKFRDLQARTGWKASFLSTAIKKNLESKSIIECEGVYVARTPFDELKLRILSEIQHFHKTDPLAAGILRETLREKTSAGIPVEVFKTAIGYLEKEGRVISESDTVRAESHSTELSAGEKKIEKRLTDIYTESGLKVPTLKAALNDSVAGTNLSEDDARKIFQLIVNSGKVLKITDDFYFGNEVIKELVGKVRSYAEEKTPDRLIGVPEFKEVAGVSRKYAIPLLEYLDG